MFNQFKIICLFSIFGLTGCETIKTNYVSIPDQYIQDCLEPAPPTVEEYIQLSDYRKKEEFLFDQNDKLRIEIKNCNLRLKAAREYQKQAQEKLTKKMPL